MNVEDVKDEIPKVDNKLEYLFKAQEELYKKYIPLEKKNIPGIHDICPVDIESPSGQYRIKDYLWRITEEIGESFDAYTHLAFDGDSISKEKRIIHVKEELGDALHFYLELFIHLGMTAKEVGEMVLSHLKPILHKEKDELYVIIKIIETTEKRFSSFEKFVEDLLQGYLNCFWSLTMIGNCLKQKPWKMTHQETDIKMVKNNLAISFLHFLRLCILFKMDDEEIFKFYFWKNLVNQFRIRSQY